MRQLSAFENDVYDAVKRIPVGKVATYAQIALISGHRGSARAVGNALHKNPMQGVVPCHRVVNASGMLASEFVFGGKGVQKSMLESEGVKVVGDKVDLLEYQWRG